VFAAGAAGAAVWTARTLGRSRTMRPMRTSYLAAIVVSLAVLVAVAGGTAFGSVRRAGAHASSGGLQVGIGDEQATMFSNANYQALNLKIGRYITPYDVIENPAADDKATLDAWLTAASNAGVQPLIAFSHSDATPSSNPSKAVYTADVKAFLTAYPQVKLLQPWDEANDDGGGAFAAPTPRAAAQYYLALKAACHGCTIVGLDVLDSTTPAATVRYIDAFKAAVGKRNIPKIWGLHNYSDTNRFTEKGTKAVLAATTGQVWLTETGGLAEFNPSFPFNLARQAKAVRYMFKLATLSRRITRLYIYQWTGLAPGSGEFDAGLTDVEGTPRPAYCVVYEHVLHTATCPVTLASD
jgi:hypothetical protein